MFSLQPRYSNVTLCILAKLCKNNGDVIQSMNDFLLLSLVVTLFSYLPLHRWEEASMGTRTVGRHSAEEGCCVFVSQVQESGGECPRLTVVPSGGHLANQVAENRDEPEVSSRAALHAAVPLAHVVA